MPQQPGGEHTQYDETVGRQIHWAIPISFLKTLIVAMVIGLAIYNIALLMVAQVQPLRIVLSLTLALVAGIAWIQLVRGHAKPAVATLGIGSWACISILAFFFGGVDSTPIILYPLIILSLGWLIGISTAWIIAFFTVALTLGLVIGDAMGFLPAAPPIPPVLRWITQCFVFLITAVLISNLVRSYRDRIDEVHRLGSDLARRTSALQAVEADLNRAQAVAHIGSWIYDLPNDKMTLSTETCRIFGLRKRNSGSYRSYRLRVHPEDREAADAAWQTALKTGASFDSEHRIVIGRTVRWIRQRAEFEADADGRLLRAVGTTQDITERTVLEGQLRESQKMEALGTLAGGIAHDFNNVLAAIMGNVELARQDVGASHPARISLDEIAKAGNRAKALVQQILAFGRRQVLLRKRIALAPVVMESMCLLRASQPAGATLRLDCAQDVPMVMADAAQIAQVLVNLCTNAWHAIEGQPRPGLVDIGVGAYEHTSDAEQGTHAAFAVGNPRPGRYACLSVRDNGVGMDEATRRRIFEPFFTTKPVDKGTGLGLAVVHGIAQGHDAVITVESVLGEGTTFRTYFPSVDAPEADAREPGVMLMRGIGREVPQPHAEGKQILYVDDDEALGSLITRLLQRQGYHVRCYSNPEEALAAVRANPMQFDLVVTDYNMPGTSGLTVAQEVKNIRAGLPVAMVSGYLTDDLREKALAAGVRDLLYKPNTVEELCEAVARLVR